MRAQALFNPARWTRWAHELREIWAARRHSAGFIATSTTHGVRYTALPERVWPTKSFEFWTFLLALLQRVRPETLIEIGSGRSTIHLSDYASKHEKPFLSLEESPRWADLNNAIARFGAIPERYVKYVPLEDDGFFERQTLETLLPKSPDFAYLDGPIGPRNSKRQIALYRALAQTARLVVLDDVQFPEVYPQIELFRTTGIERNAVLFRYPASRQYDNYVAVLYETTLGSVIDSLVECLELDVYRSATDQICVDTDTGDYKAPIPLPE
jgi:predicted O-methyltransferase YrrM